MPYKDNCCDWPCKAFWCHDMNVLALCCLPLRAYSWHVMDLTGLRVLIPLLAYSRKVRSSGHLPPPNPWNTQSNRLPELLSASPQSRGPLLWRQTIMKLLVDHKLFNELHFVSAAHGVACFLNKKTRLYLLFGNTFHAKIHVYTNSASAPFSNPQMGPCLI